jgi:hypothetical protein
VDDTFDLAIKEHLELQRRNRLLEAEMPLELYKEPGSAPAVAAPVSASASAVLEETQEWALPEDPTVLGHEPLFPAAEELWSGTPAFDWGD